jgi:hypothetical protein
MPTILVFGYFDQAQYRFLILDYRKQKSAIASKIFVSCSFPQSKTCPFTKLRAGSELYRRITNRKFKIT